MGTTVSLTFTDEQGLVIELDGQDPMCFSHGDTIHFHYGNLVAQINIIDNETAKQQLEDLKTTIDMEQRWKDE